MISVGIDVSKEKSTVCILKPYGEIICSPYEIKHTESELLELSNSILRFNEEVKVVMEATGVYHIPVLNYLKEKGIYLSVINPLIMKKYVSISLRKCKTDKLDSAKIANYGIDNWFHLEEYKVTEEVYDELKLLGRQYSHYIKMKVESKLALENMLNKTMPGIKKLLQSNGNNPEKDKLNDFVETYWHFDNITKMSEKQFVSNYLKWAHTYT